MLALFRNNRTATAILLFGYVVFTRLMGLMGYVHPDTNEVAPGGMVYQKMFGWFQEESTWSGWSLWGAIVLVFIQAVWINYLADSFRLLSDRNWLPGVFYVLITAFLPEFIYLSPPLVAMTFIPPALFYIFKTYKTVEVRYNVLDAALWLTVASLFYPPAFSLLLAGFIGLLIVRSFKFKERMVYLTGIMVPFFLAWLWHYWSNDGVLFWKTQLRGFTGWYHFSPQWTTRTYATIALAALLTLFLVLSYGSYTSRKLVQVRNYVHVLYVFIIVAGLSILLQGNFYNTHLLLFMPSAGVFLAMTMSEFRRQQVPELIHLLLLLVMFTVQTY